MQALAEAKLCSVNVLIQVCAKARAVLISKDWPSSVKKSSHGTSRDFLVEMMVRLQVTQHTCRAALYYLETVKDRVRTDSFNLEHPDMLPFDVNGVCSLQLRFLRLNISETPRFPTTRY